MDAFCQLHFTEQQWYKCPVPNITHCGKSQKYILEYCNLILRIYILQILDFIKIGKIVQNECLFCASEAYYLSMMA